MTGDCHVRICGSPGLQCPGPPDRRGPRIRGIINTPPGLRSAFWSPSPGSPVTSAPDGTTPVWQCQVESPPPWSRNARLDTASPGWLASPADVTGDPGHHLCVDATSATLCLRRRHSRGRVREHGRRSRPLSSPSVAPRTRNTVVVSWIPRHVGGRSQPGRTSGVKPSVSRPHEE